MGLRLLACLLACTYHYELFEINLAGAVQVHAVDQVAHHIRTGTLAEALQGVSQFLEVDLDWSEQWC